MDYNTFVESIQRSTPQDWLANDEFGVCVLKNNLMISIQREEKEAPEPFHEEWAVNCPDPNAYTQRFFLKYGDNIIDTFWAVSIDGNRATIPYPRIDDMTISSFQYAVACILNECFSGDLDNYMQMKNITVRENA